jgi:SNF2 family DNA or RNA helicase
MKTNDVTSLFDALRRASDWAPAGRKSRKGQEVFFQLVEGDDGFLLRVVDKRGEMAEVDYRAFGGAERELLKAYDELRWSWDEASLWDEDPAEGVLLERYPHLLWMLERCEHVVDEQFTPVSFSQEPSRLAVVVDLDDPERIHGRLALRKPNGALTELREPKFLTESRVLDDGLVHETAPLGGAFRHIALFADSLPRDQANEFLALLVSTFPEVEIECPGYEGSPGDPVDARPAMVFRQVDEHTALHIDVLQSLPGFSLEFARDYDLARIVVIDEIEHVLRVCEVRYGDVLEARQRVRKQLKKILRSLKSADAYLDTDEEGFVLGPDLAAEFLRNHLAELVRDFELFGAEKLKAYKIKHAKAKLKVRLSHGIDFLEGDADLDVDGERFSLPDALRQYRKQKYIALKDGVHAVLDESYMERLDRLFKKHKKGVRVSFFDLPLIEDLMEEGAARASLPKSREVFLGFNTLQKRRLSLPGFKGKLRPYQKFGVKWLAYLHEHRLGGCLADDMGLGKTIQTIALLARIQPKARKPSLVVMPRSLLFNWQRELDRFGPQLTRHIHYGAGRDLESALDHDLVLTTYGTLRADVEAFAQKEFHAVVLDESQAIKNLKTQTSRAVLTLKCEFRLALSGTPIENHLGELYTLFRFLNPTMFGSAAEFERHYATPIHKTGDRTAAAELRRKIKPFILRRLKEDVLADLPPKIEQVLMVPMGEEQRRFYEQRRIFYQKLVAGEIERNGLAKSRFAVLEALLELRQIATVPEAKTDGAIPSAKREMLAVSLAEAAENNRKCLVFTNFLAGVEQTCALLEELGIPHLSMTGATANRKDLVDRFQNDPRIAVFVMTLKTGGVGLNLTAADTVFILDPWWNTSAETQAIDRTHRIGQKKSVFTYRLIAENSIEEKILELQKRKKELVDMVVSSDGAALKTLTEEDIDHLLGE